MWISAYSWYSYTQLHHYFRHLSKNEMKDTGKREQRQLKRKLGCTVLVLRQYRIVITTNTYSRIEPMYSVLYDTYHESKTVSVYRGVDSSNMMASKKIVDSFNINSFFYIATEHGSLTDYLFPSSCLLWVLFHCTYSHRIRRMSLRTYTLRSTYSSFH